jgi:glutaredoxin 3
MKITVYSTTTCPYCVSLKQWLDQKKVSYTGYMVDKNPYAAQMMIQQSGQQSVPFSTIEHEDGTINKVVGFDRNRLETILQNSR